MWNKLKQLFTKDYQIWLAPKEDKVAITLVYGSKLIVFPSFDKKQVQSLINKGGFLMTRTKI